MIRGKVEVLITLKDENRCNDCPLLNKGVCTLRFRPVAVLRVDPVSKVRDVFVTRPEECKKGPHTFFTIDASSP